MWTSTLSPLNGPREARHTSALQPLPYSDESFAKDLGRLNCLPAGGRVSFDNIDLDGQLLIYNPLQQSAREVGRIDDAQIYSHW